jgi:hypothetical protein
LRRAADAGLVRAQLHLASILDRGTKITLSAKLCAHYFKIAADQGSIEGMIGYARYLLDHAQNGDDITESEQYFMSASEEGMTKAQIGYGIALLSGRFGRFDFEEAHNQFAKAAQSSRNPFAIFLCNALTESQNEIMTPQNYESVFAFVRIEGDEDIPMIHLMNADVFGLDETRSRVVDSWRDMLRLSNLYLRDLLQMESSIGRDAFRLLLDRLMSSNSISDMIPRIFRMYSIHSLVYRNVNHFMRCFPVSLIGKFLKELRGLLSYIHLLQSSITYCSRHFPLVESTIVYRGIRTGASTLVPLYTSMIDEVIVWTSFTSTSRNRRTVVDSFIQGEDSVLFVIELHPGDVCADIHDYSEYPNEKEILIAASSAFIIVAVDEIVVERHTSEGLKEHCIAQVTLRYCSHWHDFEIGTPPRHFIIE